MAYPLKYIIPNDLDGRVELFKLVMEEEGARDVFDFLEVFNATTKRMDSETVQTILTEMERRGIVERRFTSHRVDKNQQIIDIYGYFLINEPYLHVDVQTLKRPYSFYQILRRTHRRKQYATN